MSRFYNPYSSGAPAGGGVAAFMYKPEEQKQQTSQYYLPDRRRQITLEADIPQQNDLNNSPPAPEKPLSPEPSELAEPLPTENIEIPTTVKALPELVEPEIEEVEEPKESRDIVPTPKKRVTKKKQVKKPVDDDDEDEEYTPKIPKRAFFPMFFGWGSGRSSGGAPNGAIAIANAFSTGRGGVATSDATAYGPPKPE